MSCMPIRIHKTQRDKKRDQWKETAIMFIFLKFLNINMNSNEWINKWINADLNQAPKWDVCEYWTLCELLSYLQFNTTINIKNTDIKSEPIQSTFYDYWVRSLASQFYLQFYCVFVLFLFYCLTYSSYNSAL